MGKYPALVSILLAEGLIRWTDIIEPCEAEWDDLALVHTPEYLGALQQGCLDPRAERRIGIPMTPALVRRSRLAVQGTYLAAVCALEDGVAGNIAGGTHHAFSDHGEGYCVLNDVAVAIRKLQRNNRITKALIIDLDVHQGNGTAAIFAGDSSVYTFSMHGQRNYPWRKVPSTRDIALADYTGDDAYMELLSSHLPTVLRTASADIAFYLAGVDPASGDRLGRLSLSRAGIKARDRLVLQACRQAGLPLALVMAGGYAKTPQLTADLHAMVYRAQCEILSGI